MRKLTSVECVPFIRGTLIAALMAGSIAFSVTQAATLTWDAAGDGHSWNDAANWGGTAPGYYDTLDITTSDTIDNVYRDTSNNVYVDGYTWRGTVNLNQGTVNLPTRFDTGSSGIFNIGDGTLTGGARDAVVNLAGNWRFDRHGDGTFTLNIHADGALLGGTFEYYADHPGRNYVVNVDGGRMSSPNAWNMGLDPVDVNRLNISNRGSVSVGSLAVDNDVIDLLDRSASFTAGYGGSFADIGAVRAAIGTTFISSSGPAPMAADNQNGTYTVGGLLPPTGGTVPGGFADTSNLLYHLDAATGVSTSGSAVTGWADQGPAGNDFSQADANMQPLLIAGALGGNALPAVQFDGATPYANGDKLILATSTQPRSVVIVNEILSWTSLGGIWGTYPQDTGIRENGSSGWHNPGNSGDYTNPAGSEMFINGQATGNVGLNTPHILSATRASSITFSQTGLGSYFYDNPAHGVRAYNGAIGEVLAFDRVLNDAELRVVENHLSAKYDIALAAGDHYAGDDPGNGDYDLDVVGIGRVDSANSVWSAGDQGLGIAAYALEDGDWVLAGHKSIGNAWVSDDLPPNATSRWDRVWYVDETGSPAVTLAFNHEDGGLAAPEPGSPIGLLYSPTNAFAFEFVSLAPEISGDLAWFTLAAGQLQDGYYTLGVVPEPSTLALAALGLLGLTSVGRRRKRT